METHIVFIVDEVNSEQQTSCSERQETMYARVTTGYVQPGKMDELNKFTRETVVPLYQQQQGFKGALFLTDHSANKQIAIALWETEADMAAGEASGGYYREELAKMAHVFASAPVREAYEVALQE